MADTVVSRLVFEMAANVATLQRDMADAKSSVGGAMDDIRGKVAMVQSALVALGAAAGVGHFAGMISSAINAAESLHDLSLSTGASVESLSAFAEVGRTTGTTADMIAGMMNKLAKNTAFLDENGRGAAAALRALGIDFQSFQSQTPDEKMMTVAQAMNQFADGSEKSAVAQLLLGKAGAESLPYLKDLAEAGELNARYTTEQADAADSYNDSLTTLSASGEQWKKELAMGILPAMEVAVRAFTDVMRGTDGLNSKMKELNRSGDLKMWASDAITVITMVWDAFAYLGNVFSTIGGSIYTVLTLIGHSVGGLASMMSSFVRGEWAEASARATHMFSAMGSEVESLGARVRETWGEQTMGQRLRARIAELEAARAATAGVGNAAGDTRPKLDDLTGALDDVGGKAKEVKDEFADLMGKLNAQEFGVDGEFYKHMALLEDALGKGKLSQDEYGRAVDRLLEKQPFMVALTKEAAEAAKAEAKEREDQTRSLHQYIDKQLQATEALRAQVEKERESVDAIGLSKQAQTELTAAKHDSIAASIEREAALRGEQGADEALVNMLSAQAAAHREMAGLIRDGAARQAAQDTAAEYKKAAESINGSLTDALMRGFEDGKGFGKNLRDTLENMFQTLVLRPVISAVMSPISQGISAIIGQPQVAGAGGGILQAGSGLLGGLFGGGGGGIVGMASDLIAPALSALGIGGGAALTTAAGLGGSTAALGLGGLGTGAAEMLAAESALGAGAAAGGGLMGMLGAIPGWGWALAGIAIAAKMFEGGETRSGGSYEYTPARGVIMAHGPSGGEVESDRVRTGIAATASNIDRMLRDLGSEQRLSEFVAGFATSEQNKGTIYAGGTVGGVRFGEQTSASQGLNLTAEQAVQGFTTDLKRATLQALQAATDIPESISAQLRRLDADAMSDDSITEAIVAVEGLIQAVRGAGQLTYALEPLGGVFGRIAALGIDARIGLIEMAGGIDSLIAKTNKFVELYYSEAERGAIGAKSILDAASGVQGIGDISTMSEYRALLESQNTATEAGLRAINTMLDLAPTFAAISRLLGGDAGVTLAMLAGQAADTPAADFLAELAAQNGDTGAASADLMQRWMDQSQRASDTLHSLVERLIEITAIAAEQNAALLARIADEEARAAAAAMLELQGAGA